VAFYIGKNNFAAKVGFFYQKKEQLPPNPVDINEKVSYHRGDGRRQYVSWSCEHFIPFSFGMSNRNRALFNLQVHLSMSK